MRLSASQVISNESFGCGARQENQYHPSTQTLTIDMEVDDR